MQPSVTFVGIVLVGVPGGKLRESPGEAPSPAPFRTAGQHEEGCGDACAEEGDGKLDHFSTKVLLKNYKHALFNVMV
jgi:hypothetical protein